MILLSMHIAEAGVALSFVRCYAARLMRELTMLWQLQIPAQASVSSTTSQYNVECFSG